MKINNECARRFLLEIEKIPYGEVITVAKLQENISDYNIEDVFNIVTFFGRDNILLFCDRRGYDDNDVFKENKIKCLTDRGFQFLDSIRNEDLWNLVKEKIDNFNDLSIYTIFDIARRINNIKYNELFDLPRDY